MKQRSLQLSSSRTIFRAIFKEACIGFLACFAYFGVRGLTEGSIDKAHQNAERLMEVERILGIFDEPALQALIATHHFLVTLANWVYIWGHWPVIIAVAFWLMIRRPSVYLLYRNAFLISGGVGLVFFILFPVAPPRLTDLPVIDTVTIHSNAYRVMQPPAWVNQYAAFPSLHFGWNLLIGIALASHAPFRWVRVLGLLLPIGMGAAVVLTANHYIIDVLGGGVIALISLGAANFGIPRLWSRGFSRRAGGLACHEAAGEE